MAAKILVVDDSGTDRKIIKSMLEEYEVLLACDGVEALCTIDANPDIDLMILDLNMPNMNGFQVLEMLKSNKRDRRLCTMILTNYDEMENEIKGLQLGAVDYIRKPINMESLRARINIHIELLKVQNVLEQKLNEQKLTFDMIFDQAPIGIAISQSCDTENPEGTITRINSMYEKITGRTLEELAKLGWEKITHPDDLEEDLKYFRKLQSGEIKSYSLEKRYIKPDGSFVWVYMVVAALTSNRCNYICLIQDISERKKIESNLKYINEHDKWTGLYNRDYLGKMLQRDLEQMQMLKAALISVNLSTVQLLTVNYGFNYTRNLIKKAAVALSRYCNEKIMLFNTSENHFVFYLLDYEDKKALKEFSQVIADTLESLLVTERIGGGIGVLEIGNDSSLNVDLLLRRLLIASERAINVFEKDFSVCFYDKEIEALVDREGEIRQELSRIAFDDNCGELFLQYQPILDLKTDSVCGFEALARLKTEKLGLVSPVEFIPIAEKTKLIIPIGKQIILSAFRFINKLKEHGYGDIDVSVNISAIQLFAPDFTKELLEMIRTMGVNPQNLVIEITESVFSSDYDYINNIIGKLRADGICIAIDDFGTGFSSLARERELNVNCLKIDKYFIDKLMIVGPSKAITGDIISMAHKRGHFAIAEGVETQEQKQYLLNNGCDKIQGYLVAKPLYEEEAIAMLGK